MKKLELNQMENVEGGEINPCNVSLSIALGIWTAALGAATFGVAAFFVGVAGSAAISHVC